MALVASAMVAALQLSAQNFDPARAKAHLLAQCPALPAHGANEAPIHVDRWGGTGPRVLLIHGGVQGKLGGGPSTFDQQKALVGMGWTVFRVDRPGFGASPSRGPDDQESAAVWAADMLGGGTHLIGHSFGGAISLLAAARHPESVRSLILVEPGLQPLLAGAAGYTSIAEHNQSSAMRMLAEARTPGDFAIAVVKKVGTDGSGGPNQAAAELTTNPESAKGMGCALLRARQASAASLQAAAATVVSAHIPVLVISGGYDPLVDQTDEAIAHILHGTYVKVQSPNHFVMQANPADFNRTVDSFMRKANAADQSDIR